MKAYRIATISAALIIGIGATALADTAGISKPAPSGAQDYVISQLESASAESDRQAAMTKGSGQQLYKMKRVQLNELIERLQRGEQVAPEEIDNVLKR